MPNSFIVSKDSVSKFLCFVQRIARIQKPLITVLGYHAVSNDKTIIDITPAEFKKQILLLIKSGYDFISVDQLAEYLDNSLVITKPSVVMTFDDGYSDLLTNVIPYLQKKNIPLTIFVIADSKTVDHNEIENNKKIMNKKEIKSLLHFKTVTVGGHTVSHSDLSKLSQPTISKNLKTANTILQNIIQKPISTFAYPWGRYSNSYINSLKKVNYKLGFSTEAGFISPNNSRYVLPRIMVDRTHSIEQFSFMLTPLYPVTVQILEKVRFIKSQFISIRETLKNNIQYARS